MNDKTVLRQGMKQVGEYFYTLPYQEEALEVLAKERMLKVETLKNAGAFYVSDETPIVDIPEFIKTYAYGLFRNNHLTIAGRLVYPVKDNHNDVMGFCSWDKFDKPKYRDSATAWYKAKSTTLYGEEMLPLYYDIEDPIFIYEGIVDTLWTREQGLCALASLGSHLTPYQIQILQRLGRRCIVVADRDEAGDSYVRQVRRVLPKATPLQPRYAKDLDDMRKLPTVDVDTLLYEMKSMTNPLCITTYFIRR